VDPELADVRSRDAAESEETYLLSMGSDASVKIRDGVLDVKILRRVNGAGLQLWTPVLKAEFPVAPDAVATALRALGVPEPTASRSRYDRSELLSEVIGVRDDLRVITVHKSRRRAVLDECWVEYTVVTTGGMTTTTVAVESDDRDLVTATVGRLGLAGRHNICLARGLKTLLGWSPAQIAVVDVGTNSVKFVMGGSRIGGLPFVEVDTAMVTRLGEGMAATGEFSADAMGRTVEVISAFVEDARDGGPVDVVAVGTAGLRQAANRDDLLDAVLARCGVVIDVISGPEEARLAYLAAVSSLSLTDEHLLAFDSGGGSTQFTWGSPGRVQEQFSLDVGAVRLTERLGLAGAVSRDTVHAAIAAITDELRRLADRPRPDRVVAIGGTSTNLAAVQHRLLAYDPDIVHGTVVGLDEVDRQIEVYRRRSADDRREIPGLQPARAEVILAGACIVRAVLGLVGQRSVTVSDRGLRHGVLLERSRLQA
jgi:exopolyphosphatase/guanosine-5'-triphosphate,3'-diphosphate pyrophosphatase